MCIERMVQRTGRGGRKGGFTLVELLVVISIIAVLLTILLPSLQAAKQQAQGTLCVAHLRSLGMSWAMYADDHEGRIVGGVCAWLGIDKDKVFDVPWACYPTTMDGTIQQYGSTAADGAGGNFITLEDRLRGIRDGALFPYAGNDTDIYHCPSDKRMYEGTRYGSSLVHQLYRSYSIQHGLNSAHPKSVKRLSALERPEETYVFVEEPGDGGCFNVNSGFILDGDTHRGGWWSVVSNWHNGSGTLSFGDGHAERRVWQDERTYRLKHLEGWWDFDAYQPDNLDLQYMARNYAIRWDPPWWRDWLD